MTFTSAGRAGAAYAADPADATPMPAAGAERHAAVTEPPEARGGAPAATAAVSAPLGACPTCRHNHADRRSTRDAAAVRCACLCHADGVPRPAPWRREGSPA